ncbi:MAG: membrane transporter protein [Betaproteobacteria bacterium]|nr:membrane transporter protein [Betaproteobacteria bacterium]
MKQLVMLALQVSIVCTVFRFGLETAWSDLIYVMRQPGLLFRSLAAVFVVMPVLAVVCARLLDLPHAVEVVLVALAISPVPPLLPRKETEAGGHSSYGLGLMALMAVLAVGSVPLAAEFVGPVFDKTFAVPAAPIARIVLVAVVVPLAAGMLLRARWPTAADRLGTPVRIGANVLLALAIIALLVATLGAVWAAVGDGTVVAIVAFVVVGLLVGHLLGGPDPEHAVVLALSTACRHPGIAFAAASAVFPEEHFGGTMLLYVVVSTLVAIPYLAWRRKRVTVASA